MMKVEVDYQDKDTEKEIYKKINSGSENIKLEKVLTKEEIFQIWNILNQIYVSENIFEYVSKIIDASRNPQNYKLNDIAKYIQY
jgi:MoxR-like ATPase